MMAWIRRTALITSLGLSAILWLTYYTQYFKWRSCFNELGRCFDEETGVTYLQQSNLFWLPLAVLFSCISVVQLWRFLR